MKPVQIKKIDLPLLADPANWNLFGLDPNKGLGIIGNIGVGKTTTMHKLLDNLYYRPALDKIYAGHRISQMILKPYWEKTYNKYESIKNTYLFVDDLAAKGKTSFADQWNPAADLLNLRYNLWQSIANGTLVPWDVSASFNYFTCNYDLETLAQELGPDTIDRLHEMCNFVYVGGTSYRSGNLNGKINGTG
jgi:DNA replication protein DnaC